MRRFILMTMVVLCVATIFSVLPAYAADVPAVTLDEIRGIYAARAAGIKTLTMSWDSESQYRSGARTSANYFKEPRTFHKSGSEIIAGNKKRLEENDEIWNESKRAPEPNKHKSINVFDGELNYSLYVNEQAVSISKDSYYTTAKYFAMSYCELPPYLSNPNVVILRQEDGPKGPRIVLGNTDHMDEMDSSSHDHHEWMLDPNRGYVLTGWSAMDSKGRETSAGSIDYRSDELLGQVPTQLTTRQFQNNDPSVTVGKETINITDFKVNEPVDPSVFTLEFPPGTRVNNEVTGEEYVVVK